MNENQTHEQNGKTRLLRPKLRLYHANPKGTGCALTMELHPAHDETAGSIMMSVANQLTKGDRRGPNPTFPTFDWENKITVKLEFADLCRILQVLRGECECLEGERGIYHQTAWAKTQIALRHLISPVAGYSLDLFRVLKTGEDQRAHFHFYPEEALGLLEAISGSMAIVTFGIPMVIPHDTSSYKAGNREGRDVRAA